MLDAVAPRPYGPMDYGLVAVWFALGAGVLEVATHGVRRVGLHQLTWASQHVVWMTPLSYLLLLVPPALVAGLVAWRWPRVVPMPGFVGLYAAALTAALLILLSNQRLYLGSVALVALAVGVQALRWSRKPGAGFRRFIRRTTPMLAGATMAVVVLSEGSWWLAERWAVRRLPAIEAKAPNILLLILDTVRAANLGIYGYRRPTTPVLDRLAARGAVFERALSTSSWTLQSHASFFTGRLPHELSPDFVTPLDGAQPTLAEVLRDHGYLTAGFVANHSYASAETGLARGFIHYEDYRLTLHQILLSSELGQMAVGGRSTMRVRDHHMSSAFVETDLAVAWLSRNANHGHPYFAFINYMDAHLPYRTPPEVARRFTGGDPRNNGYDAAIAFLDQELGVLFRRLESSGILTNTVVVVTSDHGEQLGEHGLLDHGNSLYIQLLNVPLIVVYPSQVPAGLRVPDPVSLRDLPATILSLAGLSGATALPGRSLERFWNPGGSPTARVDSLLVAEVARRPGGSVKMLNGEGKMWSLLGGRYHYIAKHDGSEELFDYWSDPAESLGIADTPGAAALLPPFRAAAVHLGAQPRRGVGSP